MITAQLYEWEKLEREDDLQAGFVCVLSKGLCVSLLPSCFQKQWFLTFLKCYCTNEKIAHETGPAFTLFFSFKQAFELLSLILGINRFPIQSGAPKVG